MSAGGEIERMWLLFHSAETDIIGPDQAAAARYVFFAGAWAAFHALNRTKFSSTRIVQLHDEMRTFRDSIFE